MNHTKHVYWYFESVLSDRFCDHVIKLGNSKQEKLGVTGAETKKEKLSEEEINNLKLKRDSNIVWLSDQWIYNMIHPYVHIANKNSGWNYEWSWSEACQFTKYKLNQHYDWHKDTFDEPFGDEKSIEQRGKIRKLSLSCLLSDPEDYEGGDMEFQPRDRDDPNFILTTEKIRKKGTIIIFPSYIWHRVKPVTKGTRYSLVVWNLGKPYV